MIPRDSIICGRAEEVLAGFSDACVDLTVTSPPYDSLRTYNGYTFDFDTIARQLYRVTKPGGVVVWVVGDETRDFCESGTSFRQALGFMDIGFKLHDTMIYGKKHYAPAYPSLCRYAGVIEFMFVFSKGRPRAFNPLPEPRSESTRQRHRNGSFVSSFARKDGTHYTKHIFDNGKETKDRTNLWMYAPEGQEGHPAPFPERLAEDHILSWSNAGDLVLDPMCGSGTALKMAIRHHRHFVGIDISEAYCQLTRRRISAVQETLL